MSLDARNADFWDELCGTSLARSVGATSRTPEDLARFDRAYLDFYPYLASYVPADLHGEKVLEVGLGYGTLGALLVARGATYTGIDIARGPVEMMRHRIGIAGRGSDCEARQASVLDLPFPDAHFDRVVSIGCLHHTGDLPRAVEEVRRVLRPGGEALVMVYNRWSARRLLRAPVEGARALVRRDQTGRDQKAEDLRARYDVDSEGNAAPHTDFVSVSGARRLFAAFSDVRVERRNLSVAYLPPARPVLLRTGLDRVGGLDLYIRATA